MASYNKYNIFTENLSKGVHVFGTNSIKVLLSNTTPNASTHALKSDATEISAGNGYSAGGATATASLSRTGGVTSIIGVDVVFTASGGTVGPFRYAILWDDTPTSPLDPLIGWWDYGSSITLNSTETFTVDFGTEMFTVT